jgi:hypothetical protein
MAEAREAGKVVRGGVDLLHEWRLGVYQSVGLQHPVHLGDAPVWIGHVLQHRLRHYQVERCVLEWDVVRVAREGRPGS